MRDAWGRDTRVVPRLLRSLTVVVLVLGVFQQLTAPTALGRRTDPVVLSPSSASVAYGKHLVLTATVAAPQPAAQVDFYAKPVDGAAKLLGSEAIGADAIAKLAVPVTRTATYYAVLVEGGVPTSQSAPVDVVVAPTLVLGATRVMGPVNHFTVRVRPALDGIPVVLQQLVGKRWKKVEKDLTEAGRFTWTVGVPGDVASKWRVFVRASSKYGESTSKAITVIDPRLSSLTTTRPLRQ